MNFLLDKFHFRLRKQSRSNLINVADTSYMNRRVSAMASCTNIIEPDRRLASPTSYFEKWNRPLRQRVKKASLAIILRVGGFRNAILFQLSTTTKTYLVTHSTYLRPVNKISNHFEKVRKFLNQHIYTEEGVITLNNNIKHQSEYFKGTPENKI